jgi:signal transduction histidine kinase
MDSSLVGLRDALDWLPMPVWVCAADGGCALTNQRWREFTGASESSLLGMGWLGCVHGDDRARTLATLAAGLARGSEFTLAFRVRQHNDAYRAVRAHVRHWAARGLAGEWFVAIHELEPAGGPLPHDHARPPDLETFIQTVPASLLSFWRDPNGQPRFSFVSPAAAALFGFEPGLLLADASLVFDRIHPDDRVRMLQTHAAARVSLTTWRCEFRFAHPELGDRWIVGNSTPLRPENAGEEPVFCGIFIDITRRKRIEVSLSLAETQLRSALEAAEMGAWVFDAEAGRMWGNRNQRELWQTPPHAPDWFDVSISDAQIHPDDRERAKVHLGRALLGHPMRIEFRIVRADGSVRWIAARARAEASGDAPPKRVAGINLDITAQKMAAEQALRSQKIEALGVLAGGIAHDFNNVLFAILGNAGVALALPQPGGDTRPMLKEIEAAARRAAELVHQILAFSRPQEQQTQVILLPGPVREALRLVRATTPSMIQIESQYDRGVPAVRVDVSRLGQVIVNLCTNAVHAIGKAQAGVVRVVVSSAERAAGLLPGGEPVAAGSYAVLSISDDGCGMDEATKARIFDPFFTTKPPGEGTGLGLSVVHGITRAFGAHIEVESEPGVGTTFRLYFPAVPTEVASETAPEARSIQGRGERIMFVDDEPMVVKLATRLLTTLGYTPEAYQRPAEALDAFRADPDGYALVITDLAMPVLSGFDLARGMLSARADLPIVLMSGNLGPDERATALRIGMREAVLKPPSLPALSELIGRLIG